MKALRLLTLLLLAVVDAHAADYGYLRVVVPKQNAKHEVPVQLFANGKSIGSFSHRTTGISRITLDASRLNSRGATTPLRAQYGDFQSKGCEFDFRIEFSFSGDFSRDGINLGSFRAPTSAVNA